MNQNKQDWVTFGVGVGLVALGAFNMVCVYRDFRQHEDNAFTDIQTGTSVLLMLFGAYLSAMAKLRCNKNEPVCSLKTLTAVTFIVGAVEVGICSFDVAKFYPNVYWQTIGKLTVGGFFLLTSGAVLVKAIYTKLKQCRDSQDNSKYTALGDGDDTDPLSLSVDSPTINRRKSES